MICIKGRIDMFNIFHAWATVTKASERGKVDEMLSLSQGKPTSNLEGNDASLREATSRNAGGIAHAGGSGRSL